MHSNGSSFYGNDYHKKGLSAAPVGGYLLRTQSSLYVGSEEIHISVISITHECGICTMKRRWKHKGDNIKAGRSLVVCSCMELSDENSTRSLTFNIQQRLLEGRVA